MSLTSELRDPKSWVNQYFKKQFANVTRFTKEEGPRIKTLETKVPSTLPRQSLARIGTAIDYRIRLELGLQPYESPVIQSGIQLMRMSGTDNTAEERSAWAEALKWYLFDIGEHSTEELAQMSILLAHLDAGFRSGGIWAEDMVNIAKGGTEDNPPTFEKLLAVAKPEETSEVVQMEALAKQVILPSQTGQTLLGPEFAGSYFVNGADADLIIGHTLYDIKTSQNPRSKLTEMVRQIIGYALLDWQDEYLLQKAGFYFSRQGETVAWNLQELLARTATSSDTTLADLRNQFARLALEQVDRMN